MLKAQKGFTLIELMIVVAITEFAKPNDLFTPWNLEG